MVLTLAALSPPSLTWADTRHNLSQASGELNRRQRISGTGLECFAGMKQRNADPRLVWLASVLAAATLVIFLAHQA